MNDVYTMKIAGLERHLPLCPVNKNLDIAAFVMFSDVELTIACASELIKKAPAADVIVTAESKGIPLAYEMARQLGMRQRTIEKVFANLDVAKAGTIAFDDCGKRKIYYYC